MTSHVRSSTARVDSPAKTVRRFIAKINRADADGLAELMTEDHLLVDSLGHHIRGREATRQAWINYFAMVRDYRVAVRQTFVSARTVVVLGSASGSYVSPRTGTDPRTWEAPGAWRVVTRRGRVAEWQVYADNEPIRALMRNDPANAV